MDDEKLNEALAARRETARRRHLDEELRVDAELDRQTAELDARSAALDERRDEQERREAMRRKLAQLLAHDLKNHLAVVKSNGAFVLEEGFKGPKEPLLSKVVAAADRALALTSELTLVERIEALEAAPRDTDLAELWDRVAMAMVPLARASRVALTHFVFGSRATLDGRLVQRILENIVDNAIRHSRATRVDVIVDTSHLGTNVCVEDDGCGLPAGMAQALSSPSPEGDLLLRRAEGLVFCRTAMMAHGGSMAVESVVPHGTRFRLVFPPPGQS